MGKVVTIEFKTEHDAKRYMKSALSHKEYWESHNGIVNIEEDWHTPHELYEHRYTLFRALCFGTHRLRSWRSLQHHDGTMFKDSFIVGLNLTTGPITYHFPMSWWERFDGITTYERAPEWDGCRPGEGLERLNETVDMIQSIGM
jgi:hypothetical protein